MSPLQLADLRLPAPEVSATTFAAAISAGDLGRPLLLGEAQLQAEPLRTVTAGEVALQTAVWTTTYPDPTSRRPSGIESRLVLRCLEGHWKLQIAAPWSGLRLSAGELPRPR